MAKLTYKIHNKSADVFADEDPFGFMMHEEGGDETGVIEFETFQEARTYANELQCRYDLDNDIFDVHDSIGSVWSWEPYEKDSHWDGMSMEPASAAQFSKALAEATTLDELFDVLHATDRLEDSEEISLEDRGVCICNLPTFGGPDVRDTSNVFSWDATRMISTDRHNDFAIYDREDILVDA
jgi:hypothetical protein